MSGKERWEARKEPNRSWGKNDPRREKRYVGGKEQLPQQSQPGGDLEGGV